MSLNFPSNPSNGDVYENYVYDATAGVWNANPYQIAARFVTSASAPENPSEGDGWFDSTTAKSYTYYDGVWVQIGAPGAIRFNQLEGVEVTDPLDGEIIVYDSASSQWVNQELPEPVLTFSGLEDTLITSPTSGQSLSWNGTDWVNGQITADGIANDAVTTNKIADANVVTSKLGPGTILQIVRATDNVERVTSSSSFLDVEGMSVTITPQRTNSRVIVMASFLTRISPSGTNNQGSFQITDSSNNSINGAEAMRVGVDGVNPGNNFIPVTIMGQVLPATTSAVTYKLRFRLSAGGDLRVANSTNIGQIYAIEVSQ